MTNHEIWQKYINSNITCNYIMKFVNSIYSEMENYFISLLKEYNLDPEWNRFILYSTNYRDENVNNLAAENCMCRMVTISSVYGDPDNPDFGKNDQIIEEVDSTVYMSYQAFYEKIICCIMDYDNIVKSLKFTLRHEIGHIIINRSYIGKKLIDWEYKISTHDFSHKRMPKLRKNASMESRRKWILMYNNLPDEKYANIAVGITNEDIIEDFMRTNGC